MRRTVINRAHPGDFRSRCGFAAVKELSVVVLMVCLLFCGLDGAQRAIRLQKPQIVDFPLAVHALAADDAGEALWVARMQSGLTCLSTPDLSEREFLPSQPVLSSIALRHASGSTVFVTAGLDGMVDIDVNGERVVEHEVSKPNAAWIAVAISGDARVVVATTQDGVLHRWVRREKGFDHDRQTLGFAVSRLSLDQAGHTLAALNGDSEIRIWDLQQAVVRSHWKAQHSFCSSISLSADGERLATTGNDGKLCVWRVANGHRIWERMADVLDPVGATFSPCRRWVVSGGFEKRVLLWDAETGRFLAEHVRHARPARVFAWSGDSRTIYSSGMDGRVQVWQVSGTAAALAPSNSVE